MSEVPQLLTMQSLSVSKLLLLEQLLTDDSFRGKLWGSTAAASEPLLLLGPVSITHSRSVLLLDLDREQ
jgi:hypothetical protein